MKGQVGFWDVDERYARPSAAGASLDRLNTVAWKMFRKPLASPRLAALISAHKACFARLRERAPRAFENEVEARSQIIAYEPRDDREALERLSYLFAIIATANDWLDDDEIEDLLTMVRSY